MFAKLITTTLTKTELHAIMFTIVFATRGSSYIEQCINEYCFTTPGSEDYQTFSGALSWCQNHSSELAVVSTQSTQDALTQFLNSTNLNLTYINLKLSESINRTWYLVNGSLYLGWLGNQNNNTDYYFYACLKYYNTKMQVDAAKPNETKNYICDFAESACTNASNGNCHVKQGKCYVKYENESVTWFEATKRCYLQSGDLATFNYPAQPTDYGTPIDTSWLNKNFTYWVGIRWKNLSWSQPEDKGNEIIETWWSQDSPKNYPSTCVCVDPNGRPPWSWTDCDCSAKRSFVCLTIDPAKITTSSYAQTSTLQTTTKGLNSKSALALGLGVGLGCGGFVLILIIVAVVVIAIKRRKRKSKEESTSSSAFTVKNESKSKENSEESPGEYAAVVKTESRSEDTKRTPQKNIIYSTPDFNKSFVPEMENPYSVAEDVS